MRHVHAFGDDALGDLDAVALVDALRTGRVSAPELVEAAIARTKAVNPVLNGWRTRRFDQARPRAAGSPPGRLLRRRADVHQGQRRRRGHADHAGHRRLGSAAASRPRRVRAVLPGHRSGPAGQDATVGVRLQRLGRASAHRSGPQPLGHRLHRGSVLVGIGRVRRRRGGAHRARQRRWRLDPNSGRLQRSCRPQALPRPAAAGQDVAPDAGKARQRRGTDPLGARYRRVLP